MSQLAPSEINRRIDLAMEIEGMSVLNSLRLIAAMVGQVQSQTQGDSFIELGTYKGRVAAMLGLLSRDNAPLTLVDVADYLERDKLSELGLQFEFIKDKSENFCARLLPGTRFTVSHHDASHYFSNVHTELTILSQFMDEGGLMILDDFTDPFNQVRAAYYHARYVDKIDYEFILYGFGKAFLVHSARFREFEVFILDRLQDILQEMGLPTLLYRTDNHPQSRAFSIAHQPDLQGPRRYGLSIWGDRFYKPSKA